MEVTKAIAKLTDTIYTPEQLKLITDTVARGATADELKLFLYRAKHLGLDPLKPGQIFFIKYSNASAGTIVVGLDGFRVRASRTGLHAGTKRGVIYDDKGNVTGGWAEVYRRDWAQPAREEVSLKEYTTGRGNWTTRPETMIKKVAEVAALRMAFADELGGAYIHEEMERNAIEVVRERPASQVEPVSKRKMESLGPVLKSVGEVSAPLSVITPNQRKEIFAAAERARITQEDLRKYIQTTFHLGTTHALTLLQYNRLMAYLNVEIDRRIADEKVDVERVVKVGTDDVERSGSAEDCADALK